MSHQLLDLLLHDPDPPIACDRGVALVAVAERQWHAPDRRLLAIDGGSLVARCSCWWTGSPSLDGEPVGIIGHYAAADGEAGMAVVSHACRVLAAAGCTTAVGPMDGSTWRRYRFIVERGSEPAFFLEPDNPDDWPRHWSAAGFSPLATYTSALNHHLDVEDPRAEMARSALSAAGISIRAFDPAQSDVELRRILALSLASFSRNFLYSPMSEPEFMAQNQALLPHVRPELILLAERDGLLLGFAFAVPDMLQARRGVPIDTVILKTIAVDPSIAGQGVGGVLVDLVQRAARQRGFARVIHALMHETNASRSISNRSARTFRRYALFSRELEGGDHVT